MLEVLLCVGFVSLGLVDSPVAAFARDVLDFQQVVLYAVLQEGILRTPYDRDLLDELNVERYQLTKTGKIALDHPEGTHDDRFWALALAVYAAETASPTPSRPIARTT